MDDSWFNAIRSAMTGDVVAREAALGVATDLAANLGVDATYRFLRAYVAYGYWDCADIKLHHSYNGLVSAGEGWMLCDGRTIGQSAYDTEHGSGHWATFVGTSPLNGLKLPNFTGKYALGASSTTETGSGTIAAVGNTSHQINMQHRHKWYRPNAAGTSDQIYDSSGNLLSLSDTSAKGAAANSAFGAKAGIGGPTVDYYTTTPNAASQTMSATQSIQPESIEFQFYMRVI
jgi:hypothetical protein